MVAALFLLLDFFQYEKIVGDVNLSVQISMQLLSTCVLLDVCKSSIDIRTEETRWGKKHLNLS